MPLTIIKINLFQCGYGLRLVVDDWFDKVWQSKLKNKYKEQGKVEHCWEKDCTEWEKQKIYWTLGQNYEGYWLALCS